MSVRAGGDWSGNAGSDGRADIAAAIKESLAGANYGANLAARGVTIVALDSGGRIVEYSPDGVAAVQPD